MNKNGFTLIELMVTITIMGIVTAIGVPSFKSVVTGTKITTTVNKMVASINFSRSEAVKRNQYVVLLKNGVDDKNWSEGWKIFVDENRNQILDSNDELLKEYRPIDGNLILLTDNTIGRSISYTPTGVKREMITQKFNLHSASGEESRSVEINVIGRPKVTK